MVSKESIDNPEVIAFPPALYGGTLALGLLLSFMFPINFLPRPLAFTLGASLIICAGLIVVSAFRAMSLARTAVDPSQPTTAIVSDGAFGFTRNPIYLALTLLYVGIALLFNALWALLLLLPLMVVMQRGVVEREERYLERKFGEEYRRYKARVRRWV